MDNCPKCGSLRISGPFYRNTHSPYLQESLQYICSVCGFSSFEQTKDAQSQREVLKKIIADSEAAPHENQNYKEREGKSAAKRTGKKIISFFYLTTTQRWVYVYFMVGSCSQPAHRTGQSDGETGDVKWKH